jgi:hypothetical protein
MTSAVAYADGAAPPPDNSSGTYLLNCGGYYVAVDANTYYAMELMWYYYALVPFGTPPCRPA